MQKKSGVTVGLIALALGLTIFFLIPINPIFMNVGPMVTTSANTTTLNLLLVEGQDSLSCSTIGMGVIRITWAYPNIANLTDKYRYTGWSNNCSHSQIAAGTYVLGSWSLFLVIIVVIFGVSLGAALNIMYSRVSTAEKWLSNSNALR